MRERGVRRGRKAGGGKQRDTERQRGGEGDRERKGGRGMQREAEEERDRKRKNAREGSASG